jgi:hypothetical protein
LQNIAKAQKEIEKLEAEANDADLNDDRTKDLAKKPSQKQQGINGGPSAEAEARQEADAEKDVAEEMEKAKIEDQEDASTEA